MKGIQGAGLDQVTGLPKVDPRQFWRVRYVSTPEVYGDGHYVQLMEFRPTWWRPGRAVLVDHRGIGLTGNEIVDATRIRSAAEAVLQDRRRELVIKGMLGDYPPKRL